MNQGVNFISMIVLARLLYPSEYGTFALIQVFTAFIAIFLDNGIIQAVIRNDKQDIKYLEKLHSLSFVLGIICLLTMFMLAFPIAFFYKDYSLILPGSIIAFNFVFNSLLIVPTAALQQELNFKLIGKIQIAANLLAFFSCFISAIWGFTYWALIIREFVFSLTQLIILLNVKKVKLFFDLNEIKKTFLQIKQLMINVTGFGIINFFSRNTDNLLIGKFYGEERLGIYNRAYSLIYLSINLISGIINQVLFPSLVNQDLSKIRNEYYFSTNIIAFLLFPVMLFFNLFPEKITFWLWGNKWMQVSELLPYIGILIFSQCQLFIIGNVFVICKKEKYLIWMALINTVLTVSGIIIGLFFSLSGVIKFYTLFYIALSAPIAIYVVYFLILPNTYFKILKFWLPKILITWTAFLLAFTEEKVYLYWILLTTIFYFHIFLEEKNLLVNLAGRLKTGNLK